MARDAKERFPRDVMEGLLETRRSSSAQDPHPPRYLVRARDVHGLEWFTCPREDGEAGVPTRTVPYEDIAARASREYDAWRTVPGEHVHHSSTAVSNLLCWFEAVSVEDLARLLDGTPHGLAAHPDSGVSFDFTFWQRVSMAHYADGLLSVTSRIHVSTEQLRALADYDVRERNQRKLPLHSEYTRLAGSPPDVGLVDLPTAAGKTAWSMSVAAMLVADDARFQSLVSEHAQKRRGALAAGPISPRVARLVLVATSGATFDHFETTLRRLLPTLHGLYSSSVCFRLWTTVGAHTSVALACPNDESSAVVTMWLLPMKKLLEVLRATPEVVVPVCVLDEFTVDTPRERYLTDTSPVLKQMILQATPQALENATHGTGTFLKEVLGGPLCAPRQIPRLIQQRCWKQAQLTMKQACLLDLMTVVSPFRALVRRDLAALMPPSLVVHFVKSRRMTMASHLLQASTDLVPASLSSVLIFYLRPFFPTPESVERLVAATSGVPLAPRELAGVLDTMVSTRVQMPRTVVDRLKERVLEFANQCPICLNEDDDASRPSLITHYKVFPCCGYAVCTDCFLSCGTRCGFCRSPVQTLVPRPVVEDEDDTATDYALYPEVVAHADEDTPPSTLSTTLARVTSPRAREVTNLTRTLQALVRGGYKRILLLLERTHESAHLHASHLNVPLLSMRTGVVVERVDHLLSGKGSGFAAIKRRFDSPDPSPMAMLCYGLDERFLVGTDAGNTGAVVSVGHISHKLLDQALGRIFRARKERDNTRPVVMVQISAA